MIDVYVMSLSFAEAIKTEYCERHFPKRLAKARRFLQKEDYLRSIGAGYLLFEVLGLEDKDIEINETGKPFAKDLASNDKKLFNLSHSGNFIVLASSSSDDGLESIGVDIEEISEKHTNLSDKICAFDESLWINDGNEKASRFTRLWTIKEASAKASGESIFFDLNYKKSILSAIETGKVTISTGKPLYIQSFNNLPGYWVSIASDREEEILFKTTL